MPQTQQKPKREIYLLLGENEVEKEEYIRKIVSDFSKGRNVQFMSIDLELDEDEGLRLFSDNCNLKSLFGDKKVIVLKINKSPNKLQREVIISGLSNAGNDLLIVITSSLSPYKFDKSISLAVESKGGEVKTFWKIFENNLTEYVENLLSKNGIEISEELVEFLIERNGNDPNKLYEDVRYIKNYFQTSNLVNSRDAMEALFLKSGNGDIFLLVSSIIKGEKHKAILTLNDMLAKGEDVYALGILIYRQVEKIINVKNLLGRYLSDDEISKQLGISTFEVRNIKKLMGVSDNSKIMRLFKLATVLDRNVRSTASIRNILLEKAIVELL